VNRLSGQVRKLIFTWYSSPAALRTAGSASMEELQYALLENHGKLSVQLKKHTAGIKSGTGKPPG
jgi:uncharacterized membrane protein YcaP (DUF421 family)